MPQLHLYVPQNVANEIKRRAQAKGISVSKYLAEVVRREVSEEWPGGFFSKVVGGWSGETIVRPPQGDFEEREPL